MTLYVKLAQRGALTELCTRELTCLGRPPPRSRVEQCLKERKGSARNPGDAERRPANNLSLSEIETFYFMKALNWCNNQSVKCVSRRMQPVIDSSLCRNVRGLGRLCDTNFLSF